MVHFSQRRWVDSRERRSAATLALGTKVMTLMNCGGIGRCCNAVGAPFVLRDAPDSLELEGLRCSGDESKLCCPYSPRASAIAVGTLVKVEDLLAKGYRWTLRDVTLCTAR